MKALMIGIDAQVCRDLSFCLQVKYPDITIGTYNEGYSAIRALEYEFPDLVFVGQHLHGIPTIILIPKIRELYEAPLLVVTDEQNELRQAEFLEKGADELVAAHFGPMELLAKIGALIRRVSSHVSSQQTARSISKNLAVNFNTREVICCGKPVHLTRTEFNLLSELVRNEGHVLSHQMLLERIWGSDYSPDTSFLKKYIYRLRSKIELNANVPQMILNERGVGYRFAKSLLAQLIVALFISSIVFRTIVMVEEISMSTV